MADTVIVWLQGWDLAPTAAVVRHGLELLSPGGHMVLLHWVGREMDQQQTIPLTLLDFRLSRLWHVREDVSETTNALWGYGSTREWLKTLKSVCEDCVDPTMVYAKAGNNGSAVETKWIGQALSALDASSLDCEIVSAPSSRPGLILGDWADVRPFWDEEPPLTLSPNRSALHPKQVLIDLGQYDSLVKARSYILQRFYARSRLKAQ